ncbi:hypothetical protein IFM89_016171 [Coptis chinensis]|uniref:F-box domain-containing protein n=1 Tax=Coptis chinensis TaxID=261450 RepID=A0A835GWG2_9MAGN|nr:hypothetical protein IFM89_016171 [Coptis chinensis]
MGSRNLQIPSPKKLKIDNNGDRISTLPNTLLHEILALLDMKQVVQTSVLSTRWRDLWTSISTLNFNSTVFLKSTKKAAKDKDRFIEFVDQALLHHDNSSLKTFRLFYDERRRLPPKRVYSWIRALVRRNVQELDIHIPAYLTYCLPLPLCLFTCESLRVLKLRFESLSILLTLPKFISLPFLKTLHLEWVDFVDVKLTSNLLSSCPDLESLIIVYCRFAEMKNLVIFNLKLKHLVIENCSDGEDECEKDYCLESPVSLVEVRPLQFLNLRHLNLITWLSGDCIHAIAYLLNSSPNVESLNLKLTKRDVYVFDGDEEVFHPTIASKYQDTGLTLRCMYNLKYVEIQGILGCPNGLKFLEVLLKNALVLEKMVIFTFTEHLPNKEKWLMKFIEKLQKISRASSSTSIFVR